MSSLESRKNKDGRIWWQVRYQWNSHQERIKIGYTSKRVAKQRQLKIDNQLALNIDPKEELKLKVGVKLSELLLKDATWCAERKQPRTIQLNKRAMELLIGWIEDVDIKEIKHDKIELFMIYMKKELKLNNTTINMQIRQLKAVFQRAVDEYGFLKEHPFRKVTQNTVPKNQGKITYLTLKQIDILLESVENKDFLRLIKFYLWTGCRRTEALDLVWNDIDTQSNLINLGQPESKTKLRRSLPINDKLRGLLKELKDDSGGHNKVFWRYENRDPTYVSALFARLRKKMNELPNTLSPHLLRHSFASHLVMQGVDLTTIASFLGHSTAKVTESYAHLQPDHKLSCLNKLPY
jgi:integrase